MANYNAYTGALPIVNPIKGISTAGPISTIEGILEPTPMWSFDAYYTKINAFGGVIAGGVDGITTTTGGLTTSTIKWTISTGAIGNPGGQVAPNPTTGQLYPLGRD